MTSSTGPTEEASVAVTRPPAITAAGRKSRCRRAAPAFLLLGPLVLCLLAAARPAAAAPQPDPAVAVDRVISEQIADLRRGDGAAAFRLASPHIQAQFVRPDEFMQMVSTGYAPLLQAREQHFGMFQFQGTKAAQELDLVAADGSTSRALYLMEREPGGQWRVDGCVLSGATGRTL